jgi:hypothetical protein
MKRIIRLVVRKETVRRLTDFDLAIVAGADVNVSGTKAGDTCAAQLAATSTAPCSK